MKRENIHETAQDLRTRAETFLQTAPPEARRLAHTQPEELIHEVQVHQIELEIQNEELRRIQQELQDARDKYLDLYDFSPTGSVTINQAGLVLESNLTAATMLGVDRSRLMKKPLSHFVAPEDQDTYYLCTRALFQSRKPQAYDLVFLRRDGSRFKARVAEIVPPFKSGNLTGRITICDITDPPPKTRSGDGETFCEEGSAEQRQQLEKARQDLEEIWSFARNLRPTAVSSRTLSSDILLHHAESLPPEIANQVARIRESNSHLVRLIDCMIDYRNFFQRKLKREHVCTTNLVQGVVKAVHNGKAADFQVGQLPDCHCDPRLLEIVFNNLLSNALTFTSSRTEAIIEIGGRAVQGSVVYFVRDNGIGFDMLDFSRLFEFPQEGHNPETFNGMGPGLAMARQIVQLHNGHFWAEGTPGKGACFYFSLPA